MEVGKVSGRMCRCGERVGKWVDGGRDFGVEGQQLGGGLRYATLTAP